MEQLGCHWTEFHEIWCLSIFRKKTVEKIQVSLKTDNIGYLKTNIHFFIISRSFILRMKNVSDKSCREKQKTNFVFSNFLFSENRSVYEIM